MATLNVAVAETLRMGGTGALMATLPSVFAAFDPGEEIKLEVIPSLGSGGGLRAAADGVLDIAISGRPLTQQELAQGLTQALAVRTPFGLVTSHSRPNGLKSAEIADLFKAANAAWADGSPMRIILRPKSDSDTPFLGGLFPGMAAAIEQARQRPDVPVAANDQDNADLAERVPDSLTAASFTQIKMEQRKLRFVAVDGVEPSLEAFESGAYPFARTYYFVLPAKKSPAAERFVAFLRSPEGQAALRATGNIRIPN